MSQSGIIDDTTGLADIELIAGNVGGPIGPDALHTINILGGNNITTTGLVNTLTIDLTGTTDHAVQVGNATGSLTSLAIGTNGQVLLGSTGANPIFATLTSIGGTVTYTPGPGSLNLEAGASVPTTFTTDAGNAIPALNILNVLGGNNIITSGAGNTVTIDLNGTTDHAIQIGNATNSITSIAVGNDGFVLIGATGADPAFAALTSTDGSITFTPGANTLDLSAVGGTTDVQTLTGDIGGAVGVDGFHNINILGGTSIDVTGNPGTNTLTIDFTGTGGINQLQIYYVGKHGNDANSGLNIEEAKLTFGSAITAATAALPTAINRFVIYCFDEGIYTENITCVPYVDIFSPNATAVGIITCADNSDVKFHQLAVATGTIGVVKTVGTSYSNVDIDIVTCLGTGIGFLTTVGVLNCKWKELYVVDGFGVGDLTSAIAHMHVSGGDIYISGTGTGIARANLGTIVGHVDHILDVGAGLTTGIQVFNGTIDISVNKIDNDTAYNVSGATSILNLACNSLVGTRTIAAGGITNIISNNNGTNLLTVNSGAAMEIDSATTLEINSSGGVIGIGNDAVAQNINIGTGAAQRILTLGNATLATSIVMNVGTGNLDLGVNATVHTTRLGSTNGASQTTVQSGTAGLSINATGAASPLDIDSVGQLQINSSASTIDIGNDAVAQNMNIGTGGAQRIITIGNITNATAVNINTGTAGSTYTTTNGTFALNTGTGAINIGTDGVAKTLTLGNGTGATSVVVDCGTGALNIGTNAIARTTTLGNTTGASVLALKCGTGDFSLASATGNIMVSQDTGETTFPLQPAFLAYLGSSDNNVTGNGGVYTIGSVTALTEVFDQNSDFNVNGTFTAPVTGRYHLNSHITYGGTTNATAGQIGLVTSNRTYNAITRSPAGANGSPILSELCDMDAADTATVNITVSGEGANTDDVVGSANIFTSFSGYLEC